MAGEACQPDDRPVVVFGRDQARGAGVEGTQLVVDHCIGPDDLVEDCGRGGALPDLFRGFDWPHGGDVAVDVGCRWFCGAEQEEAGVQFGS
ncbi:hypothetical protein ABT266_21895 [Amycolatopsis sp. NPDC000746]|uniref:hypothetical protein n=1 Tax=unclassified Amycolatopsis TaxID=2618356 RepID=UPI0033309A05